MAVFCDGDFWHGKDWRSRRRKLLAGTNPDYWVSKIQFNIGRDKRDSLALEAEGWKVLRFWESGINDNTTTIVNRIVDSVRKRERQLANRKRSGNRGNLAGPIK